MSSRVKILLIVAIFIIIPSLSLYASGNITKEQVTYAVAVSYRSQIKYGIPCIAGKETKGVAIDKDNNIFLFNNCDITVLSGSESDKLDKYTQMSGKVRFENSNLLKFDVTLSGKVELKIKYEIGIDTVKKIKSNNTKDYQLEVEANGNKFSINFVEALNQK